MSYYTAEKQMSFGNTQLLSLIIPDPGASIAVSYWNGNEWVIDENSPITNPSSITTQNLAIKFEPAGGGFHIDEAARL